MNSDMSREHELEEVAQRTGLALRGIDASIGPLPIFEHELSGQQFVLVPGGKALIGMSGQELLDALVSVHHNTGVGEWVAAHRARFAAASPVRAVDVEPFLLGRSPLLGRAVDALRSRIVWQTLETAERGRRPQSAALLTGIDAQNAVSAWGWELPSEVQWEHAARVGGGAWAGGDRFESAIDSLVLAPEFDGSGEGCDRSGVWGLGLGEWVADQWHESYSGAPTGDAPWRASPGAPGAVRGGGALTAPWQDRDEAIACHAASRGGDGAWRGVFAARPVVRLPWLSTRSLSTPGSEIELPAAELFEQVMARYQASPRVADARARTAREDADRLRRERLRQELPGTLRRGRVRTTGEDGVHIIRMDEANGILRLAPGERLEPGEEVTVRVVGEGGVPDLELVERGWTSG